MVKLLKLKAIFSSQSRMDFGNVVVIMTEPHFEHVLGAGLSVVLGTSSQLFSKSTLQLRIASDIIL